MLRVEEIVSFDQWRVVRGQWDKILRDANCLSPFFAYDWFECSVESFGNEKEIKILLVWDGSQLIGLFPFWQFLEIQFSIPIRKIGFISNPDTPFVDFFILAKKRQEVLITLLDYLLQGRKKTWDVLSLEQWPGDSQNFLLFRDLLSERGLHFSIGQSSQTPFIQISGQWETFLQTRSVRFRKSHRNIVNKIHRLPNVDPQCFVRDSDGVVFDTVLDIAARGWKHKEGLAISSREDFRRFFKRMTGIAGQKGWLMVWLLNIDGKSIAVEYDFVCDKKVYALRADFDEAYQSLSPGAYLEYHIIKFLFENDYIEYSTGPGLNAYKLNWTDQVRVNFALQLYNKTVRGLVLWKYVQLRRFLKQMRDCTKEKNLMYE